MPNYLLQWEALRWSLAQGCTVYDWWGAPVDLDDPADGLHGVWQFKQGFGAEFQPHIGAWDYVVSPAGYRLYMEAMPRVLAWMRGHGQGYGNSRQNATTPGEKVFALLGLCVTSTNCR